MIAGSGMAEIDFDRYEVPFPRNEAVGPGQLLTVEAPKDAHPSWHNLFDHKDFRSYGFTDCFDRDRVQLCGKIYEVIRPRWYGYVQYGWEKNLLCLIEEVRGIELINEDQILDLIHNYYAVSDSLSYKRQIIKSAATICLTGRSRPNGYWFPRFELLRSIRMTMGPRPQCVICGLKKGWRSQHKFAQLRREEHGYLEKTTIGQAEYRNYISARYQWGVTRWDRRQMTFLDDVCSVSCIRPYIQKQLKQKRIQTLREYQHRKKKDRERMDLRRAKDLLRQVRATLRERSKASG